MDSDGDLRCNNHKCRRLLESSSSAKNKIVVTLCSRTHRTAACSLTL